ncbi:MAG: DUF4160 domain-containing protein [Gemmatimonadetes bacterium]|nr:DUF4160 domain-containing protein [Gemmatimonadota bacterium]
MREFCRLGEKAEQLLRTTLVVLRGDLPPRVLGLVTEWAAMHRGELLADWQRAQSEQPLQAIEPLE